MFFVAFAVTIIVPQPSSAICTIRTIEDLHHIRNKCRGTETVISIFTSDSEVGDVESMDAAGPTLTASTLQPSAFAAFPQLKTMFAVESRMHSSTTSSSFFFQY